MPQKLKLFLLFKQTDTHNHMLYNTHVIQKNVFCETINAWKESFYHNTCNVVHLCGQGAQSLIFYISNSMNYTTKEQGQAHKYCFNTNKNTFFLL